MARDIKIDWSSRLSRGAAISVWLLLIFAGIVVIFLPTMSRLSNGTVLAGLAEAFICVGYVIALAVLLSFGASQPVQKIARIVWVVARSRLPFIFSIYSFWRQCRRDASGGHGAASEPLWPVIPLQLFGDFGRYVL